MDEIDKFVLQEQTKMLRDEFGGITLEIFRLVQDKLPPAIRIWDTPYLILSKNVNESIFDQIKAATETVEENLKIKTITEMENPLPTFVEWHGETRFKPYTAVMRQVFDIFCERKYGHKFN